MKKTYGKTYDKWVFHGMTPFFHPPQKDRLLSQTWSGVFSHVWPVFFLTSEDEDTTGSHRRSPRPLASPMFSPTIFSWVEKDISPKEKGDLLWIGKKIPHVFVGWKLDSIYTYFWSMVGYVLLSHFLLEEQESSRIYSWLRVLKAIILSPTAKISFHLLQKTNESSWKIPPNLFLQ